MAALDDDMDDTGPDEQPQGALSSLQAPAVSPSGRAWADNYLKAHPEGVDTSGEAALFQQQDADAQEARATLQAAREHLASQRMDPSVLGLRFAQAMMAPSKYAGGMSNQLSNALGSVADWKQQNQEFQQQQSNQDTGLAQQLSGVDQKSLQAKLALQELKERTQASMFNTALKATASDAPKPAAPHYSLVEHDVTMPDGTPGKQTYMLDSSSGKVAPYGDATPSVKGAGLDSRSGIMFQRVLSSSNEAAAAIKNITELPVGANTGWFGVGASPGTSLFDSAKGVLTNKLSSQDVQDYSTMLPGLKRNLATIETAGLAPQGSLTDSFGALELREGDTNYTKLHKLAEYRQIVEKGLETNLSNPKIPEEQKQAVRDIIGQVQQVIPFTHHDVTGLQQAHQQNPDLTLGQYMATQGLNKPAATGASAAASAPAPTNAKGWALHTDKNGNQAYVSPDGKQYEEVH